MIKILYGDDRVRVSKEITREFGEDYEVIEGSGVTAQIMASIFFGTSLFSDSRKILIKDISEGAGWDELPKYLNTPHRVIIWESKIDKRTATWKKLAAAKIEAREFQMMEPPEKKLVFDILGIAMSGNGKRAVEMVEQIEVTNEPYMFVGLMVSQLMKKMEFRAGAKEKRVLLELSRLDMEMKTTSIQPWLLVKSFLLRVSSRG